MIFKYAKTFNRQLDQAYTEIMADPNGFRELDRRMTHPLHPPFPPPDVENIVETLQDGRNLQTTSTTLDFSD